MRTRVASLARYIREAAQYTVPEKVKTTPKYRVGSKVSGSYAWASMRVAIRFSQYKLPYVRDGGIGFPSQGRTATMTRPPRTKGRGWWAVTETGLPGGIW